MATVKHVSVECDAEGCNHVIVMSGLGDARSARNLARDEHGWHAARKDFCPHCKAVRVDARGEKQ